MAERGIDISGNATKYVRRFARVHFDRVITLCDKVREVYSSVLGFETLTAFPPAFADVKLGNLRLLLSGPQSSAGRAMTDGERPGPGGWNRIHLIVDDLHAQMATAATAGATFRNDVVEGPGGKQVLLVDPSGNLVELFQPAATA